ncbi:MAG: hypothetical protein ACRC5H_03345 [Treponemataceae bacterium]
MFIKIYDGVVINSKSISTLYHGDGKNGVAGATSITLLSGVCYTVHDKDKKLYDEMEGFLLDGKGDD